MDYQEAGTPKPGAAVLAEMNAGGREMPLLITENYRPRAHRRAGHVRHMALADEPAARRYEPHDVLAATAALARYGHAGPAWSHPCRARCCLTMGTCRFSAECATKTICPRPTPPSRRISSGPDGIAAQIEMTPDPDTPGHISRRLERREARIVSHRGDRASAAARRLGRDVLTFAAHGRRRRKFSH